ncbi:MAG: hypothetical protein H0U41_01045 [Actinobacteria bacterium]|nr:hypothetical protein [Actinomycetota bacterium]
MITYGSLVAAGAMAANIRANAENQKAAGLELLSVRVLELVVTICRLDERFGFLVGSHASCRFESSGDRGQVEGIAHSE